jgi:hypothetical protein
MNARRLALALAMVATYLFATPAEAAKFKGGSVKDPQLAAGLKVWKGITHGCMDVGSKTLCIVSRKPAEKWENTVKQALWGQYVEGVSAAKISKTKTSLASAVSGLFDANGELSAASPATRARVTNALYTAVKGKGKTVYSGGIWGAFDMSYTHVTVYDSKTKQLTSIFAGYSE